MVVSPLRRWCPFGLLGLCLSLGTAQAQSIAPAADGVGTQVQQVGETYVIDGGTNIDANLFHSFQQFGLTSGEIAHFLATPTIQNVVGRVVGGDPSVIQGLLRLTGSDANLYLLNPAGWVLTHGAQLDVPGSFGLTTSDRIGFNANFFGIGTADLAGLSGDPTSLVFDSTSPGTIINGADLAAPAGESLWLVGGKVISTGALRTEGGTITLAAVPGENQVILSHDALVVGLVLDGLPLEGHPQSITGLDATALAQTLGGSSALASATGVTIADDGTVWLTDTAAPAIIGTTLVSGQLSVTGPEAGAIDIFGQTVGLLGADLQANGLQGGGTVRIGGDYRGQGAPTATYTVVDAASQISANALQQGDGGQVIVWADGTTHFFGAIAARGGPLGGNGGFVEVSGALNLGFDGQVNTTAPLGTVGMLLLDPTDITIVAGALSPFAASDGLWAFGENVGAQTMGADAVVALLNTAALTLQATNTITVNSEIASPSAFGLTLQANNGIAINADITTAGGNVTLVADADGLNGGALTLNGSTISTGAGAITLTGTGANGAIGTTGGDGITLTNSSLVTTNGAIALTGTGGAGGIGINGRGGGQGAGNQVIGINGSDGQAGTSGPPAAISLGGGAGSVGGAGGIGGSGIVFNTSALSTETGLVTLTGTGGIGGVGGAGGGGAGGGSNYNANDPGGSGGLGGGAGGDGGANVPDPIAAGGALGGNGAGGNGPDSRGGGGGGGGGQGGTGGNGSVGIATPTNGNSGSIGGAGGGGGSTNTAGGGGGGGAGLGGGGGGTTFSSGGNGGGNGGNGGVNNGDGGAGGTGAGLGGNDGNNNDGAPSIGGNGGNGGIGSGNSGGGGGGAGGNGGTGGSGGVAIALNSGSITTAPGRLTLDGTGGSGGTGGNGGGGGGGGRGVGGGGGGGGGTGGAGGNGAMGLIIGSPFQITTVTPVASGNPVDTTLVTQTERTMEPLTEACGYSELSSGLEPPFFSQSLLPEVVDTGLDRNCHLVD